ncbi:tyrosine-type recombinase/integrase [Mucilaginibacter ginkgonis]|uniref:Site-specific integrase n=1 Tax=Mucilaginibacter ginkgonis TaxID=2682091 RepID=A0A6I4HUY5_9SPHI|nr:site-specific integrase [Mucilaginibacter ginkgonis]QQL50010.1 site-specific integrase [Mucilaginibacter ginkgonis]
MEQIIKRPKISLWLDTRRKREDNIYPLRIQVFYGRQKLFSVGKNLSESDFQNSYKTLKPKGEYLKTLKIELSALEAKANEVAESISHFTFEKFEELLFASTYLELNVIDRYQAYIDELIKTDQVGTASSYSCSINSIKSFYFEGKKNSGGIIPFDVITPSFLHKYEQWFTGKGKSRTSVGIYLRPLRKIFNVAIEDKIIDKELYPFKKYKIPTGKNTKKAIETNDLKKLFELDLSHNVYQQKARAFWFFSYQCNGMNIRDISELQIKNFHGTYFSFLRHKTKNTTKEDPKPIIVPITNFVKEMIEQYGKLTAKPNDYVFPIFKAGMNALEKHRTNQNFVRFINQHMAKIAEQYKLNIKLGTMEARHTFTTMVTRKQGLEFAQEALGHSTLSTTQNYWKGFENETKHEVADMLLNFQ